MIGSETLGIAEVSERSGVDQRVLRVWESRHGFPAPMRLPNGRRAYSKSDVETVREVLALRETGLSLPAAIERVRTEPAEDAPSSIFAGLRMRRPELSPGTMPKSLLTVLSRAIEDEYCANAERGVLFGSFQETRHYRAVQSRWRDLAGSADMCCVFADFESASAPPGGPIEVPVERSAAFGREWSVICDAPGFSVCLLARERPAEPRGADEDRLFETLWSVEPQVTREAARAALALAREGAPELLGPEPPHQLTGPPRESSAEMRALTALSNRMMAYAANLTDRAKPV